ncbi:hypothetical protein JCM8097_008477 [Rhodosporidiobolus ruineniae]
MFQSLASRNASRAATASLSGSRQILPRASPVLRSVDAGLRAAQPSRFGVRGLATSSEPSSEGAKSSRSRVLPVAGVASLLLAAGGFYLYSSQEDPTPVLAADRWTNVKIKQVVPLTPETSLFRVEVPKALLPPVLASDPTAKPILSLFVKEPNLQIQRAYTPLSASSFNPDGPTELDLVIKRYPDGEASRYIHRLGPGDDLVVRGPAVTWYYRPQDWDEVVFVVGGTGVSPAYQLIQDSFASPSSSSTPAPATKHPLISVVYASPSPSRILLKTPLDIMSFQGDPEVKLHYFVDRLDEGMDRRDLPRGVQVGMLDKGKLERAIGKGGKGDGKRRVVVVCGPEGMVEAVAGPRGRNFSQGPVGGILRELGYTDKEVVKL